MCTNAVLHAIMTFLAISQAGAAIVHVCEGQTQDITCPAGMELDIIDADYGRTSNTICVHPTKPSTGTCPKNARALPVIRASCTGLMSCKLRVNNGLYGDSCRGTYKYLTVEYTCKPAAPRPDADSTEHICEGRTKVLRCPAGMKLEISYVDYGRASNDICVHATLRSQGVCPMNTRALAVVRAYCQGVMACTIQPSNAAFGDSCPGLYKYLTVDYSCVPADETILCEGTSASLSCHGNPGSVLDITYVNYGRTSTNVCHHPRLPSTNMCPANNNAMSIVQGLCQDKPGCEISATNAAFGDSCPGTYKYLEIKSQCVCPTDREPCDGPNESCDVDGNCSCDDEFFRNEEGLCVTEICVPHTIVPIC